MSHKIIGGEINIYGNVQPSSGGGSSPIEVAKFNMSGPASTNSIAGWVNVVGDPGATIVTASDSRSGTAIGFSTVNSTDTLYWLEVGGVAAAYVAAFGSGHVIEGNSALYRGYFFNNNITYSPGKENMQISNLDNSKTYKIEILGSRQGASQPTRNSTIYCVDNSGTTNVTAVTGDYNGDYNFVFTGRVPASGIIKLHAVKAITAPVNDFGYVNLIKITQE